MTQPVLGIDISKATFDVVLISGEKKVHRQFTNKPDGFMQLDIWLCKNEVSKIHACMEATGQYGEKLATYLYHGGHAVSVVNPARIKAYAGSRLRRNKTDKADAELIAYYCLKEKPALWSPPERDFRDLQAIERRLEDLQAALYQEQNRLESGVETIWVVQDLEDHIHYLKERIAETKEAMQDLINANARLKRQRDLLVSIPGIGVLTAAKILGEIRDIAQFESARQLAAYAGVTPRQFVSGTSVRKKSRISKTGNINIRRILYMSAISAKRCNQIVAPLCSRLLERGLTPLQVVCAAIHKLLHLIYGILKSGRPFNPNYLQIPVLTT
jgi:transposase